MWFHHSNTGIDFYHWQLQWWAGVKGLEENSEYLEWDKCWSRMLVKTTIRYYLTPVRMAAINKSTNSKCWWRCGEKGTNLSALLVGMQTGAATVESSKEIPQKVKNGPAFWPSDPTSGNISQGAQNTTSKDCKHPYVPGSIIYNGQDVEAAQVSISRWVDKTTMGHLHNGILLSHKKEENSVSYTHLTLPTTGIRCRSRWSPYH